jgi:hypothetical protein
MRPRPLWLFLAVISFGVPASAKAQAPVPPTIGEPSAHALEIVKLLETGGATKFGEKLGQDLLNPSAKETLAGTLGIFEKKPAKIARIVADKDYAGVVRVITTYMYGLSDQHPFLYFQQTYKMTDRGWIITGFTFRSEAQAAFPADMVQHVR